MNNFIKHNQLTLGGTLFSVLVIALGFALNIGGLVIGGVLTLALSLLELLRKRFRQHRYSSWPRSHRSKYWINLYSDAEFQFDLKSISSALGDDYFLVSYHPVNTEILLDLTARNDFHLDESVIIELTENEIHIHRIQSEVDQWVTAKQDQDVLVRKIIEKTVN